MVYKLYVDKIMTDDDISDYEGEYFNENFYKGKNRYILKGKNVDVYTSQGRLLLKIRRNVIPKKYTNIALDSLLEASKKKHENRGAAAGVLDKDKMANYIGEFVNPGKFRTGFYSSVSGKKSNQLTSNLSKSNIVGYYDVPDRNLKGKGAPCRLTAYNRDNPISWKNVIPFIQECDKQFKKLIPDKYKIQRKRAELTPNFTIENTAYSTITINYSWRTGLHRDIGDLKEGFGNLIVIEDQNNKNTYDGCYLGFPQYGIAVDVRTGDYLAMDVHEWHCNTEFKPRTKNKIYGNWSDIDIKNNWYFNRLSMVMYLREKMVKCQDKKLWKNKIGGGNQPIDTLVKEKLPKEYIDYMNKHYGLFN